MGPNYKRIAIIPDTYDEGPITANDLLDLLPFQQFTINDDEELVSTELVSEFDLSPRTRQTSYCYSTTVRVRAKESLF